MGTLGKRVWVQIHRRFESCPLRHILLAAILKRTTPAEERHSKFYSVPSPRLPAFLPSQSSCRMNNVTTPLAITSSLK